MTRESHLESTLETDIVNWVKVRGGRAVKLKIDGERGFPDRTIFMPGGLIIFVELKKPGGGKLSPMQTVWIRRLRKLGFTVAVCRSLEEVQAYFVTDQDA